MMDYDPVLGRLNQVDPLANKYGSLSPYHYSFNNPVRFNDPRGLLPDTQSFLDPWRNHGDASIAGDQARNVGGSSVREVVSTLRQSAWGGEWSEGSGVHYYNYFEARSAAYSYASQFDLLRTREEIWQIIKQAGLIVHTYDQFIQSQKKNNLSASLRSTLDFETQEYPTSYRVVMNTNNVLIFVSSTPATSSTTIERAIATIFDYNGNILDQFGKIRVQGSRPWQGSPARTLDLSREVTPDMQDFITGAAAYRGANLGNNTVILKYINFIFEYDPGKNPFYNKPTKMDIGAPYR